MSTPTANAGAHVTTRADGAVVRPRNEIAWRNRLFSRRQLGAAQLEKRIVFASVTAIIALSSFLVALTAARPSFMTPTTNRLYFPSWMAGPLGGVWPGAPSNRTMHTLVTVVLVTMYLAYVALIAFARSLSARAAIVALVSVHVAFLLAPPLQYTDVFNYIHYARMGVVDNLNPYVTAPIVAPHNDPAFAISNWHWLVSPYGPLFTLLTYAFVPFGVAASFWSFKLIVCLSSLAVLGLVWSAARELGRDPVRAVVLVGLNPIALVWGLGADHNDILMMLPLALGVRLLIHARAVSAERLEHVGRFRVQPEHLAAAGFVAAAGIKLSAAVVIPVAFAAAPRRRPFGTGLALAGIGLGAASVLAFGAHVPGVGSQIKLVTDVGPANLLGWILGQGGETDALRTALTLVTACVVIAASLMAARRERDWLALAGASLFVAWLSTSWFGPWYIVWVLPFAALAVRRRLAVWVLVTGVYILIAFGPQVTPILHSLHFDPFGSQLGRSHQRAIHRLVQ
jgi:hypothetical protein